MAAFWISMLGTTYSGCLREIEEYMRRLTKAVLNYLIRVMYSYWCRRMWPGMKFRYISSPNCDTFGGISAPRAVCPMTIATSPSIHQFDIMAPYILAKSEHVMLLKKWNKRIRFPFPIIVQGLTSVFLGLFFVKSRRRHDHDVKYPTNSQDSCDPGCGRSSK